MHTLEVQMKKHVKKLRRKSVKKQSYSQPTSFVFRRVIIFTSCFFVILTLIVFNRRALPQSILGASIVRPLYAETVVSWNPIPGAQSYNIYYKPQSDATFIHAVRHLPADSTRYTISFLKKGVLYDYKISAVDASGKEFWWSLVGIMNTEK